MLIIRKPDGSTEGADPRRLGRTGLEAAGYGGTPLLKVIRAKCLDCSCGQAVEVARCTATGCPLWPYRMGSNPFTNRQGGTFPKAGGFSEKTPALPSAAGGDRPSKGNGGAP